MVALVEPCEGTLQRNPHCQNPIPIDHTGPYIGLGLYGFQVLKAPWIQGLGFGV